MTQVASLLRCVKLPKNAFATRFVSKSEKLQRKFSIIAVSILWNEVGRTQVFEWFHRFKEGRSSVESNPRSERPSTSRNEEMIVKVRTIFRNNRRLTVREIVNDCGISVVSCDAENDWKNGGMVTGSYTMTMRPHTLHILCSSFWSNTEPLCCRSRHTHQISHRVTFYYSQGLRKYWKDTDLRQRRT
jgi:hypothetical protein